MKYLTTLLMCLACISCGTMKTVDAQRDNIIVTYGSSKTYCESIPRVYSGAVYNFCLVYGEPRHQATPTATGDGVPIVFLDFILSSAADTLVLPYTAYLQLTQGSIQVVE